MFAAVYCRVSTEKDDQINSLESQREYFLHYIEKCQDLELYQIYADRGISGTAAKNRTRFMQMIEDAEKGRFQIIITKEVSRFSRNILDAVSYSRKLKSLGVTIRFTNDGIDTSQPDAELRLSIMASLAQEESRKTSDRVKWGQTRRMESGVVFGRSLLGYDVDKGKITINPEGAEIVKMIFKKYAYEHLSAAKIAVELEKIGIKTYRKGEKWNASVIMKILKNEKYCGDLLQKKTYTPDYLTHKKKLNNGKEKRIFIENHHEAIISKKLWEEVQKEIKRRGRVKKKVSGQGTKYPLSGKIICACCGAPFVSRKRKGKNGTYIVWKCSSTVNGKPCQVRYQINDDNMLYMARHCYSLLNLENKTLIDKICSAIQQAKAELKNSSKNTITSLGCDINNLKAKKLDLLDMYVSGKISELDFKNLKNKYESLIKQYSDEIKQLKESTSQEDSFLTPISDYLEKIMDFKNIPTAIISNCIEKITAAEQGTVYIKFAYLPHIFQFKSPCKSKGFYKEQKEHSQECPFADK